MSKEKDYIQDISEIRSMMERSSKFLSLSGWAGVMAGIYALVGAYAAHQYLHFHPESPAYTPVDSATWPTTSQKLIALAIIVLVLAIGTAVFLSYQRASKRREKLWSATSKRLLANMAVPLAAGGLLILILISSGLVGLAAPLTLIFYGLALYNAGQFTYRAVRALGLIEIGLGLVAASFIDYSLLCWAIGFGALHIIYGIYIHYRYER